MRLFRRQRRRIKQSHEAAAQSAEKLSLLQDQREEVSALVKWARKTREQNHLTELFIASRK